MNREIKFRCWNGEQMVSPDYITREGVGYWKENSIPTTSKELMQFTGLNDKNGKEIYESDILKLTHGDKSFDLYKVEYRGLGFWMVDSDNDCWVFSPEIYNIEVIGNIYENKELLNE